MARRGPSDIQKQEAALQGVQRMIAPREHPVYRLRAAPDGSWTVDGYGGSPWSWGVAATHWPRHGRSIADWLDVTPDTFDVET